MHDRNTFDHMGMYWYVTAYMTNPLVGHVTGSHSHMSQSHVIPKRQVCHMTWHMTDHVPGHVTDHVPGHVTDHVPGHVIGQVILSQDHVFKA